MRGWSRARLLWLMLSVVAVGPVIAGDLKSLTTPQELALGQMFAEQVDLQ
ncbi:MAG: hypothetical protein HY657_08530 [Acidobacteria bacterium]|nr:hypothetical protein [Acidobacteriota bacterium]